MYYNNYICLKKNYTNFGSYSPYFQWIYGCVRAFYTPHILSTWSDIEMRKLATELRLNL
jgi:hypothetical protein